MNKILYFEVTTEAWDSMQIDADEFNVRGEYVEFWHTPDFDNPEHLLTLPSRRLLTMIHRPQEVRPVYEDNEQNKVLLGDWEPGEAPGEDDCGCLATPAQFLPTLVRGEPPIHITGYEVGEELQIRGKRWRITKLEEDSLWATEVEPWDGHFTTDTNLWKIVSRTGSGLRDDYVWVGFLPTPLRPDLRGDGYGYLEPVEPWGGLFVGSQSAFRLREDGGYENAIFDLGDCLSLGEVGLESTLIDAIIGYPTA